MTTTLSVTKRDGSIEEMDLNKIHSVLFWATEGLSNVSVSDIEMNAKIQFVDKMPTKDIHNTLIKAAADLITEKKPNYQYVAARLMIFDLRKQVLGKFEPVPVIDLVKMNIERGLYDPALLDWYAPEEWEKFDEIIRHERDLDFTYAATKQLVGKYLTQDRETKTIYETPQYLYLLAAATMYHNFPVKDMRMSLVEQAYNDFSKFDVSLPTPIMAGVRSPQKQFASCVLIDPDDSLTGINAGTSSIVRYISQKAGIGINGGRIRGEGSKIGKGHAVHTGVVPFYRLWQSAVKSCSQGGVRGGAATLSVPFWHQEIEDIMVLKNNKGTEDNRVRRIDYCIQFNKLMYDRYLSNGSITLFSPHDVPDLYEAFFADQNKFNELYAHYEQKPNLKKKKVKARALFHRFATERVETGRVYFMNVDHVNDHSSFTIPIYMTNLCLAGDSKVTVITPDSATPYEINLEQIGELLLKYEKDVKILSRNLKTKQDEFNNIEAFAKTHPTAEIITIEDLETGFTIKCTPDHEIFTTNRGYVKAKELLETDILQFKEMV